MKRHFFSLFNKAIYFLVGTLLLYSLMTTIVQRLLEAFEFPPGSALPILIGATTFIIALIGIMQLYRLRPSSSRDYSFFGKVDSVLRRLDIRVILALALLLRLGWVLVGRVKPDVDFLVYDQHAMDFLSKKYWMEPSLPIGASIIFAIHYYFFGHDFRIPLVTIALVSTIQVWLVYDIIINVTKSRGAANLGAFLLAIWPEHYLYVNLLGSDVLYSGFLLASLWLWSKGRDRIAIWMLGLNFLCGVALGVSHWIRQTSPVFMLAILLSLIAQSTRHWKDRALSSLAFVVGVVLVIIPIVYFNLANLGDFSIQAAQGFGWSVLVGTNPESRGRYNVQDLHRLDQELLERPPIPGEHPLLAWNRVAKEMGLKRIAENPVQFVKLVLWHKISILWGSSAHLGWSFASKKLRWAYPEVENWASYWHWLMLFLAAPSAFALARSPRLPSGWTVVSVYGLAMLLFAAVHLLVEVQPRYHHLFLPFLVLLIGQGWWLCTIRKDLLSESSG